MNHNFLPYDICEMLPKENPYIKKVSFQPCFVNGELKYSTEEEYLELSVEEFLVKIRPCTYMAEKLKTVRHSWTIIDALVYLENKGFIIESDYLLDNKSWQYTIISTNHFIVKDKFQTRIEAYIEGIKYCLLLINEQSDK